MTDIYQQLAEKIVREAVEGIEYLDIVERADDDNLDHDELEKRVRGAVVHIYIPTESGCTCLGLSHRRECPDWVLPL